MRKIYNISIDQATPTIATLFEIQGIPRGKEPDERLLHLAREAIELYRKQATPTGIIMEISKGEFEAVCTGEGRNDRESPVRPIYQSSNDLALFAVTIDEDVCSEITRLFQTNEFALGSILDTAASEGTEMAAQVLENIYRDRLKSIERWSSDMGTLRFSPGYCGWHISGQKELFKFLHPEDIGIDLNDSFLMKPLKSISGVIISGQKKIFDFEDTFSFCADCATHTCRERITSILQKKETSR